MPIRVEHILTHVSAVHAGVPIATRKLIIDLRRLGVDASLWATGHGTEEEELRSEGTPSKIFERSWPHGWSYSTVFAQRLLQESANTDLFHIHEVWTYPQYAASKTARQRDIPYILAPRASLQPWRMRYKCLKKQIYLKLLGNNLIRNACCMHAVSESEIEGFRLAGYEGPVFVVPTGITPKEFEELPDPAEADEKWPMIRGRRVVLFLSRLSPEKGLDALISSWADIASKDSYSDAMLVLAGPDDRGYRSYIEGLIGNHNLADRIVLTGMVDGKDKLALMSRADIYTLPSYSEGFSNSILENLAAGNPVLITPGCNFPDVAIKGAGLCVPPTTEELTAGLLKLMDMSDKELLAMGAKGKEMVIGNYTWEIAARKLITIYNCILGGTEVPCYPAPTPLPERRFEK